MIVKCMKANSMARFLNLAFSTTWLLAVFTGCVSCQCIFSENNLREAQLLTYTERLQQFIGRRYEIAAEDSEYVYVVSICEDVFEDSDTGAGAVQIAKGHPERIVTLGKYTSTYITLGSDWIMMQYGDGDTYSTHCNQEARKTKILFKCDPSATHDTPGMRLVEEKYGVDSNCYYLFELPHYQMCDEQSPSCDEQSQSDDEQSPSDSDSASSLSIGFTALAVLNAVIRLLLF